MGEPIETGVGALDRLPLTATRVAAAGAAGLRDLGVPARSADAVVAVARGVAEGRLRLEPSAEVPATLRALTELPGLGPRTAAAIVLRTLAWPDAFPTTDSALQNAARVTGARALLRMAERWQPWRGYAAAHLVLDVARA
jgi:AraC family transcriptional regulator of adaptative response / DNA-3-methyladenine glycosylase II